MKIKFIKNIAVIIVDITKRPTEEDDKILLETMELDYPYKIHILVEGYRYEPLIEYFNNLCDYIELVYLYNNKSAIIVDWKFCKWICSLHPISYNRFKRMGIKFNPVTNIRIGNIEFKNMCGFKRYQRYKVITRVQLTKKNFPVDIIVYWELLEDYGNKLCMTFIDYLRDY